MKKVFEYMGVLIIVIFALFAILYFNNDIGTRKSNIEKDARISHDIDDGWQVAKSTTNSISAMLFYDENLRDYTFSIYVNKNGLSFGYFYRGGGSTNAENEGIAEYKIEGYHEKVYLSMNRQQVTKIEIDDGNTTEIIDIDYTKPFAIILPIGIGTTKIYSKNGNVLPTIPQTL